MKVEPGFSQWCPGEAMGTHGIPPEPTKTLFSCVKRQCMLSSEVLESPSLEVLKSHPDTDQSNPLWVMCWSWEGGLGHLLRFLPTSAVP